MAFYLNVFESILKGSFSYFFALINVTLNSTRIKIVYEMCHINNLHCLAILRSCILTSEHV